MNARHAIALTATVFTFSARPMNAQGFSVAVGAAVPTGGLSSSAGTGYDVSLQVRTEAMFGPVGLRIDAVFDHFAGKAGFSYQQITGQALGFVGDIGSNFYWTAGPGYYQTQDQRQISGHNVTDNASYLGAQAAVGGDFPVFRWTGFLEVGAAKLFAPGPSLVYVPLRFGIRL